MCKINDDLNYKCKYIYILLISKSVVFVMDLNILYQMKCNY